MEVLANQMRMLDRWPQNWNGAKAVEASKLSEPVDAETENQEQCHPALANRPYLIAFHAATAL